MEEINKILEKTNETMDKSIEFMNKELSTIRAGKANPNAAVAAGVIDSHDENFVFQYGSNCGI